MLGQMAREEFTRSWFTKLGAPLLVRAVGLPSSALTGDLDGLYAARLLELVRGSLHREVSRSHGGQHGRDHELGRPARHRHARHLHGAAL